jgi:hypothetical protein
VFGTTVQRQWEAWQSLFGGSVASVLAWHEAAMWGGARSTPLRGRWTCAVPRATSSAAVRSTRSEALWSQRPGRPTPRRRAPWSGLNDLRLFGARDPKSCRHDASRRPPIRVCRQLLGAAGGSVRCRRSADARSLCLGALRGTAGAARGSFGNVAQGARAETQRRLSTGFGRSCAAQEHGLPVTAAAFPPFGARRPHWSPGRSDRVVRAEAPFGELRQRRHAAHSAGSPRVRPRGPSGRVAGHERPTCAGAGSAESPFGAARRAGHPSTTCGEPFGARGGEGDQAGNRSGRSSRTDVGAGGHDATTAPKPLGPPGIPCLRWKRGWQACEAE